LLYKIDFAVPGNEQRGICHADILKKHALLAKNAIRVKRNTLHRQCLIIVNAHSGIDW
jgi:hypothetical protein